MDRYGNVKPAEADTIALASVSGPAATVAMSPVALSSGLATFSITYSDWGAAKLNATGRRTRTQRGVNVLP